MEQDKNLIKINEFIKEDSSLRKECNFCNESKLDLGSLTKYGARVIYKFGDSVQNQWFVTISPKTGGDIEKDFTILLAPVQHITHFSQISNYPELSKNYGIAFAKINNVILKIMADKKEFNSIELTKENAISVGTYGKSTNWKDKKEHLHIKIFPFKGVIGQPYTVDSSFSKKEIYEDENIEKFIKMKPVYKKLIPNKRFDELLENFIQLLK